MGIRLETKQRLVALLGELVQSGVTTTAKNVPRGKQEFEGSVLYVLPTRTTQSVRANTLTNATITWLVQIVGRQVGLKLTVSAEDETLALADRVADLLNKRRLLELNGQPLDNLVSAVLTADNGLQKIEYPSGSGLEYLAYQFELTCTYLVEGC